MSKKLRELEESLGLMAMPDEAKLLRETADTIYRLQTRVAELEAIVLFCFSLNPDTSDGTEEIGHELLPMPDHIYKGIIATLKAAKAPGAKEESGCNDCEEPACSVCQQRFTAPGAAP